jgi:hypothetical protein
MVAYDDTPLGDLERIEILALCLGRAASMRGLARDAFGAIT